MSRPNGPWPTVLLSERGHVLILRVPAQVSFGRLFSQKGQFAIPYLGGGGSKGNHRQATLGDLLEMRATGEVGTFGNTCNAILSRASLGRFWQPQRAALKVGTHLGSCALRRTATPRLRWPTPNTTLWN